MREINKQNPAQNPVSIDMGKVAPKQPVKTGSEEVVPQSTAADSNKAESFAAPGAEVLGRSQVGSPDAIKEDVAFGMANPKAIEKADKFFETALAQLQAKGDMEAYEKASVLTNAYVKELCI